jgi:Xaa-Pro aminopeptidase
MSNLTSEKLAQAVDLVAAAGVDVWLTFVRETSMGGDPVLPLIADVGLVWQSALLVSAAGERVAVVGTYDAEPLEASGNWTRVVPYVEDIREPLVAALETVIDPSQGSPRIAVNYSENDVMADGLSHGMWQLLQGYLAGTRFADALESAEPILSALRARKTATELQRMRVAIQTTNTHFARISDFAKVGLTERAIYDFAQDWIDEQGLGYAWDRAGNPIVNSGPDSMVGHGLPSPTITVQPGHILHFDLGIQEEGYCSDIQRCWYVPHEGEPEAPEDVTRALGAVNEAISAAAEVLRPGVEGWQVDQAARTSLIASGYEEYLHATGHQVGRSAHDGGTTLGPRWARYGRTPYGRVAQDEVYTLELGVLVEGRGYLGIEEMVRVTADGLEWLSERQLDMPLLGR